MELIWKHEKAILSALNELKGNRQYALLNNPDGTLTIEWSEENTEEPLELNEVLNLASIKQAEIDAKAYQRDRVAAYPSLEEQLDMQYWDSINGTTVWADTIAAIKAKYPKPE